MILVYYKEVMKHGEREGRVKGKKKEKVWGNQESIKEFDEILSGAHEEGREIGKGGQEMVRGAGGSSDNRRDSKKMKRRRERESAQ